MNRRRLLCSLTLSLFCALSVPAAADVELAIETDGIDSDEIERAFSEQDFDRALSLLDGQLELYPWNPWLLEYRFLAMVYLNRQEQAAEALTALASSPEAEPGNVLKRQSVLSSMYGEWQRALDQYREGSEKLEDPGDVHAIAGLERAVRIAENRSPPPVHFAGPLGTVRAAADALGRSDFDAAARLVDIAGLRRELKAESKLVSRADVRLFLDLMLRMSTAEYLQTYGYELELVDKTSTSATVDVHSVVLIHSTRESVVSLMDELSDLAEQALGERAQIPIFWIIELGLRDKLEAAGGPPYERLVVQRVRLFRSDDRWIIGDVIFEGQSSRDALLGSIGAVPLGAKAPDNRKMIVVAGVCAGVVVLALVGAGLLGYVRRRKTLGELLAEPAPLPKARLRKL